MNIAIPKEQGGFHLLTNEGLSIGDKVFPLLDSYHTKGKSYIIDIRTNDKPRMVSACTGWPSRPHTIKEFYQAEGLWWIRTDKGYNTADIYFKLLKLDE